MLFRSRVPSPGSKWIPAAITASGGGQFVAEYFYAPKIVSPRQKQSPRQTQTRLYSFRLDASGHPTGLSLMHGGVLAGFAPGQTTISGGALAVSPDGSQVALVVTPAPPCYRGCPTEIAVINLRTGQRELWSGGLDRPGMTLSISGLSWESGSGPLVFLAQWCRLQTCAFFPHQTHIAQVRTLNLDTRGGPLTQGSVLLGQSARYPDIVAARLVPGRTALAVAVLSSPALSAEGYLWLNAQVIDVPLGGGERSSVLYHGRMNISASRDVDLSPDASGRHWLLLLGYSNNWISDPDGGRLHRLPIPRRAGYSIISQAGFEAWW